VKFIKWLLAIIGVLLLIWLGFWVVGIVGALLWYAFWIAVVGAIGYGGYRLLVKKGDTPRLEDKTPIGISDMTNADRALEEYRKKYLP
jgi:hypothetical protein